MIIVLDEYLGHLNTYVFSLVYEAFRTGQHIKKKATEARPVQRISHGPKKRTTKGKVARW